MSQKKFKVLILHTYLSDNDGSSVALTGLLKDLDFIESYKILTLSNNLTTSELNVKEIKKFEDVNEEIMSNNYDLIHNFRLIGNNLINWTLKSLKINNLKIPVITTINQRPSYCLSLLTPSEIKNSYKLVFIDNTSYNNKLISFIPKDRRCVNYYCTSRNGQVLEDLYKKRLALKRNADEVVIFGRGSTLIKCPKDLLDVFQKIDIPNKEFHIYGIDKGSWLDQIASKSKNVRTFPLLPLKDWYDAIIHFDIFLYQLPKDAYSSLDGTLGIAMKLGVPAVYYGPDAPKERFKNGINGFVANTKKEFIEYATLLAKDINLRKRIGEAGRESTNKQFSWKTTYSIYYQLYKEAHNIEDIKVPLKYQIFYYINKFRVQVIKLKGLYQKICLLKKKLAGLRVCS